MSEKKHQHIESICQESGSVLKKITQKVHLLNKLNTYWYATVSAELAAHTRVANFRDNLLIIEIDNNVWATHLRYAIPEIKKSLGCYPELSHLQDIKWYIRPQTEARETKTNQAVEISANSAELLAEMAKSISHEALRKALEHLAKKNNK